MNSPVTEIAPKKSSHPQSPAGSRHGCQAFFAIILLAATVLFCLLAIWVFGWRNFSLDVSVALAMKYHPQRAIWLPFFKTITRLCDREIVIGLTLLFLIVTQLVRRLRLEAVFLLGELGVAAVVETLMKGFFERIRPEGAFEKLHLASYAFPSGHAMLSVCWYGLFFYFLARSFPRVAGSISALAAGFAVLVGASRFIVGAHYLSDVLGGWLVGVALLTCGIALHQCLRQSDA